ncbi:MAG: AAA family ATPase [Saprospiraceae bacterium]
MLDHLDIRNFRIFEELRINGLNRINLFAGKNNAGKTALLEALRIWAAQGDSTVVNHIISKRNEFTPGWSESYDSLFFRPKLYEQRNDEDLYIQINELSIYRRKSLQHSTYCELYWKHKPSSTQLNPTIPTNFPKDSAVFIPFGNGDDFPVQQFWDQIVLTPLEDDVLHILREAILPDLKRIDVKKERTLVRLEGEPTPISFNNLGDGATRILQLAIGLASARGKMLLIDEIESGLHHSIQETLWEKIFYYAQKWDIQVFATTHSQDTVRAFKYTQEKRRGVPAGAYFRLQQARKTGKIEAIEYGMEDLEVSLLANLESR